MSGRVLVRLLMADNAPAVRPATVADTVPMVIITDTAGDELTAVKNGRGDHVLIDTTHPFLDLERDQVVKLRDYLTQWLDTQP